MSPTVISVSILVVSVDFMSYAYTRKQLFRLLGNIIIITQQV